MQESKKKKYIYLVKSENVLYNTSMIDKTKPGKKRLFAWIPDKLHQEVKIRAIKKKITLEQYTEQLVVEGLKHDA